MLYYTVILFICQLVLQKRIELLTNPYHGFVMPFNYRSLNTCMLFNIKTVEKFNFPPIPEHLILSLEEIRKLNPVVLKKSDGSVYEVDWYRSYFCNEELTQWIKDNIPINVHYVEYIVTTKPVTLHTDLGRKEAFNYILNAGGDNVVTEFYSEDKSTLIDKIVCEPETWYGLNVSAPHCVSMQTETRCLISVTSADAVTYYM